MSTPEDQKVQERATLLAAIENNECFVTGNPQNALRERLGLPQTTVDAIRTRKAQIQDTAPRRGLWLQGRTLRNKA